MVEEAERIEAKHGYTEAKKFADIALGKSVPSDLHFDAWAAQLGNLKKKTADQMRVDVKRLLKRFPVLQHITPASVRKWFDDMAASGVSPSSLARITSFCRSYWRYLETHHAVPIGVIPFNSALVSKPKRVNGKKGRNGWEPFQPKDVVKPLDHSGEERGRATGGPHTTRGLLGCPNRGALLDEGQQCQWLHVQDRGRQDCSGHPRGSHSQQAAGYREAASEGHEGWLPALGPHVQQVWRQVKRNWETLRKLKRSLGYGEGQVFHSIRKTFVTLLENAGVSENLAADIVGHEKPRITYGLYSGGAGMAQKARAVELVKYPGAMK